MGKEIGRAVQAAAPLSTPHQQESPSLSESWDENLAGDFRDCFKKWSEKCMKKRRREIMEGTACGKDTPQTFGSP